MSRLDRAMFNLFHDDQHELRVWRLHFTWTGVTFLKRLLLIVASSYITAVTYRLVTMVIITSCSLLIMGVASPYKSRLRRGCAFAADILLILVTLNVLLSYALWAGLPALPGVWEAQYYMVNFFFSLFTSFLPTIIFVTNGLILFFSFLWYMFRICVYHKYTVYVPTM